MTDAPLLRLAEVRLYEREIRFRLPFKFGAIVLEGNPQVTARVRIQLPDGRDGWGKSAEMLSPKWFDKNPALTNDQNFEQLRAALGLAIGLYRDAGAQTAFGLYAHCYRDQVAAAAAQDLNPLVACYGPALLDRAILDALCRLYEVSIFEAMAGNLAGLGATDLTPDLAGFDVDGHVRSLRPAAGIEARHTVGMADPIADGGGAINDGLPETLADVIDAYGQRSFKLKAGGDLDADITRLTEIASVLDRIDEPYRITIDGNEQYADIDGVKALLDTMAAIPALKRLTEAILFIEQPIARDVALNTDIRGLDQYPRFLIDEADATLDAFPRAKELGYFGVSSKSCKGIYKSILNSARCRNWNQTGDRYFMSAEDLTIQAGLSLQQDLGLATLIGCSHLERNGHHFGPGLAPLPDAEQQAYLDRHGDLYHRVDGVGRVTIRDGQIALGTLHCRGFATAVEPDWSALDEVAIKTDWR